MKRCCLLQRQHIACRSMLLQFDMLCALLLLMNADNNGNNNKMNQQNLQRCHQTIRRIYSQFNESVLVCVCVAGRFYASNAWRLLHLYVLSDWQREHTSHSTNIHMCVYVECVFLSLIECKQKQNIGEKITILDVIFSMDEPSTVADSHMV